ncbi:MAG: hydroxymethylglutaryl-CoA lyase [Acidobacteriaceae bacterium]
MSEIKLIECPRDAWQGLKGRIPAEAKANYLQALIAAGFTHIDAVSFVSPKAVPQMADSEKVLNLLEVPEGVEIIGIVVNEKGADRAIKAERVTTLGFPYSVSPTFLQRNQRQTLEDSIDELEKIAGKAFEAGLDVVAYISMAFGNPYGDLWNEAEVVEAVGILADMDIRQVSLADTVGAASPEVIAGMVKSVLQAHDHLEIGVHLHSRPDNAEAKVLAALDAGCRRFDSAMGGLGGCPFASDTLTGNISTAAVLSALKKRSLVAPIQGPLDNLVLLSREIAIQYSTDLVQ